jgi:hypothetical protein
VVVDEDESRAVELIVDRPLEKKFFAGVDK